VAGNGNNQWKWDANGNETRLNLGVGMGMGMNHWEWEEMEFKKSFPLISSLGHPSKFQRVSRLGFITVPTSLNGGQPNFLQNVWPSHVLVHYIYVYHTSTHGVALVRI